MFWRVRSIGAANLLYQTNTCLVLPNAYQKREGRAVVAARSNILPPVEIITLCGENPEVSTTICDF
jgi:hypothetical protein